MKPDPAKDVPGFLRETVGPQAGISIFLGFCREDGTSSFQIHVNGDLFAEGDGTYDDVVAILPKARVAAGLIQ